MPRYNISHPYRGAASVLLAAMLLLAITACQTQSTRPVAKVGLSAPVSGFDESVGYSVVGGVRMAIEDRNLRSGISGYSAELVSLDDANEAAAAARRAQVMTVDTDVMGVLGGFDNASARVSSAAFSAAQLPFVAVAGGEPGIGAGQWSFRMAATDSDTGRLAGEFAAGPLAAGRIAIISDAQTENSALAEAFKAAAEAGGAKIVQQTQIKQWQVDFADAVREVAAATPDVIFFSGRAAEAGEFIKQMRAAGLTATFLGGPAVDDPRLAQIAGPAVDGAYYVSAGFPLSQVKDAALRDRIEQASLRPPGPYTVLAYDATNLMLDALARAIKTKHYPTRGGVAAALRSAKYTGVSGEITFDEQGNRRNPPLGIYKISGQTYPGNPVP